MVPRYETLLASIPSPSGVSDRGGVDAFKAGWLAQRVVELEDVLREAREDLEGEQDINRNGGPNVAMRIVTAIDRVLP